MVTKQEHCDCEWNGWEGTLVVLFVRKRIDILLFKLYYVYS